MPRIKVPKLPIKPCPPHEWKDMSEELKKMGKDWYMLMCQKCQVWWPDETR